MQMLVSRRATLFSDLCAGLALLKRVVRAFAEKLLTEMDFRRLEAKARSEQIVQRVQHAFKAGHGSSSENRC